MRAMRGVVVAVLGVVAVVASTAGTGGAASLSIPYSCDASGGTVEVGVLSAPISITTTATPEPADVFEKVSYTAELSLPELEPKPFAINFNFFRVTIPIPAGLRDVKVKVQDPSPAVANPAVSAIAARVTGGAVVVDVPASPSTTRRFRFGTDGNFIYPFNSVNNTGGSPVVLPRIKITAMPTRSAAGATVDWTAPVVDTETGFAAIGDIPCTPDDPTDTILSTTVSTAVAIPLNPHTDVPASLDPAVSWARHLKVYKVATTRYSPSAAVTRAEAVQALWNMMDRPAGGNHPFVDVPANAPYDAALDWAFSEGIVPNPANHRFKPSNPALRGALVDMVFHMIEAEEGSPWPAEPYTDVASTAPYAEAMGWANATNTINEFAGGTQVRPTVAATRADLARILFKTAKNPTWFRPFPTTVLVAPA